MATASHNDFPGLFLFPVNESLMTAHLSVLMFRNCFFFTGFLPLFGQVITFFVVFPPFLEFYLVLPSFAPQQSFLALLGSTGFSIKLWKLQTRDYRVSPFYLFDHHSSLLITWTWFAYWWRHWKCDPIILISWLWPSFTWFYLVLFRSNGFWLYWVLLGFQSTCGSCRLVITVFHLLFSLIIESIHFLCWWRHLKWDPIILSHPCPVDWFFYLI